MQRYYEKEVRKETNPQFCKLNRFFFMPASPRKIFLEGAAEAPDVAPIVEQWCSHILSMTDEETIEAAIKAFNATMKPLAISYPARVPREFDYYDKELHATENLAQKLGMSAEFSKACIDSDNTNSRQPLSDFQLVLFNKFKLVWTEEHKAEIFPKLEAQGIKIAVRNKEISRIAGLFAKYISEPMVESFYTELSEAGMALTQEQIRQYAVQDTPIVHMLEQVRSMFDGRMDEFQQELEHLLAEEPGQSSSSCSM